MLICAPIVGLWYWCTDQYIVQRALGAPNETVARRGSIFASFLKLFPVYLFIIPGLICYALAKSGKIPALGAMVGADGKVVPSVAQGAFPMMVQYLLPPGLRGLVVAGLLSALMPFPTGLRALCGSESGSREVNTVEWAWAMNAGASVLGSVLAIVIAMEYGLTATLLSGATAYALAAVLRPRAPRLTSAL